MCILCLPAEIVARILLYLPSRSIAAACFAVPQWKELISSQWFIRQHCKRFEGLSHPELTLHLKLLQTDEFETLSEYPSPDCRAPWKRTLSNHCINCILQPHLLLSDLSTSGCYCIDHISLWTKERSETIIWKYVSWWSQPKEKFWPQCFEEVEYPLAEDDSGFDSGSIDFDNLQW